MELTKQLLESYLNEGKAVKEISILVNRSKRVIRHFMKSNGIDTLSINKNIAEKRNQIIIEKYQTTDCSLRDLSHEFNLSPASLTMILQKYKIEVPTDRKNKARSKTCLEKYGTTNVMYVPEVIENREAHFIETLGVTSPFKSKLVQETARASFKAKTGYDHPCHDPKVLAAMIKTNQKKFKGNAPACSQDILDKMESTNRLRYNVSNYKQKHLDPKVITLRADKVRYKKLLIRLHHKSKLPLQVIGKMLGLSKSCVPHDAKDLGVKVYLYPKSTQEKEVSKFIRDLSTGLTILERDRDIINPLELDIVIPDLKIAIEYNGLYSHSYNYVPDSYGKNYHANKSQRCKDQGIQLFHIFSNEWEDSNLRSIWESVIQRKVAPHTTQKVFARKCSIVVLTTNEAKQFLNENHIQGYGAATVFYGLKIKEELLGLIGFLRSTKSTNWCLTRLAFKKGLTVVGGASKLLKYFEKNQVWGSIESFADLRYSYGDVYYKLGFQLTKVVPISYYYTDNYGLYHKRGFQKKHLGKILGSHYNPKETEHQNILSSKKFRILYDCGKLKFIKQNPAYSLS